MKTQIFESWAAAVTAIQAQFGPVNQPETPRALQSGRWFLGKGGGRWILTVF
jgi:hypothetical protein